MSGPPWFRTSKTLSPASPTMPSPLARAGLTMTGPWTLIELLHLAAKLVRTLGVVGAEHTGHSRRHPFGKKVFPEPGPQEAGKRGAEQRRAQVVQLGQAERVRGVQELPERRELERLGQQRGCPGPQVVRSQPGVDVHVREHLGQVA